MWFLGDFSYAEKSPIVFYGNWISANGAWNVFEINWKQFISKKAAEDNLMNKELERWEGEKSVKS